MALSSMTGFARHAGTAEWGSWTWEARSVNGKGLDIRLNLPTGLDALEKPAKALAAERFARGNMQVSLRLEIAPGAEAVSINDALLDALLTAYAQRNGGPATGEALATLMTARGIASTASGAVDSLADDAAAMTALTQSCARLMDALQAARDQEGRALQDLLLGHLSEIESLVGQAVEIAGKQTQSVGETYRHRVRELDTESVVSDERLAVEVATLAAKADVTEELDRLRAHVETGRQYLASSAAVGRNLGFLAQEFNREANTLCSKSAVLDLTNAGLALKSVIDQFKEQAANVE